MNPHDEQKLERLIHQTLHDLPARRAPSTLEARVLAELERRAALPWWKQSFVHWPMVARVAFIVVSAGFVKLALMAIIWAMAGFDAVQFREAFATQYAWAEAINTVARVIVDFGAATLRSIPATWLYGGAAVIATLYVALVGLGTAAYRTLYAHR